LDIKFRR